MKYIIWLSAALLGSVSAFAADMQFVTTLSSPVGTFSQLDVVHSEDRIEVPVINFCTPLSGGGTITLEDPAFIHQLLLKKQTTLGGNVKEMRVTDSITSYVNTQITGHRLMSHTVSFDNSTNPKSSVAGTLYFSNEPTIQGAKTDKLIIPGQVETQGTGNGEDLEWSNIYVRDYSCKSDGTCTESGPTYTSYVLKSKRVCDTTASNKCTSSGGTVSMLDCSCICPDNMFLENGACVGKFTPKVIDIGVLVNCNYCIAEYRSRCGSSGADPNDCFDYVSFVYSTICDDSCRRNFQSGNTTAWGAQIPTVVSYEFYVGGSYVPKYFWEGGTRVGGQIVRGGHGRSTPDCEGTDYQSICDANCNIKDSSCSYKCLVSKSVPSSCSYVDYNGGMCNRYAINSPGTGRLLTCVKE